MDFKTNNYEEDGDFVEMLEKMNTTQLNSTLLQSPSSAKYGLSSLVGSPCSPNYINSPKCKGSLKTQCLKKSLSFSQDQEDEDDNLLVEIDLNKTYSSKTMDSKELSLMLAALEDDNDD